MAADLHCHTRVSDGSDEVEELIDMAARNGLHALAITDHDSFAAVPRAMAYGKEKGIEVVPGVEFSTIDSKRGRKAHILCYFFKPTEALRHICEMTSQRRRLAGEQMIKKAMELYPITREMVLRRARGSTNVYKQHIVHALMDAGYSSTMFGDLFTKLFHPKHGLAYARVEYPEAVEVLPLLHLAGGVAVLAHPGEYNSYELLEELTALGLDGVEVWHPRNREGDQERLSQFAKAHGLIMTGGTDFHGMYTSRNLPLGTCTTPDDQFAALKERARRRKELLEKEQK